MPNFCESDKNYGLDYSYPIQEIYKMVHDKETGEEKLIIEKTEDITENLKEQKSIIEAYKEILKQEAENKKAENLIDMQSDEQFMQELEIASQTMQDENIYTVMDNFQLINKVFENLPNEEKLKFKTPQAFVKSGLKDFIKKTKEIKIEENKDNKGGKDKKQRKGNRQKALGKAEKKEAEKVKEKG